MARVRSLITREKKIPGNSRGRTISQVDFGYENLHYALDLFIRTGKQLQVNCSEKSTQQFSALLPCPRTIPRLRLQARRCVPHPTDNSTILSDDNADRDPATPHARPQVPPSGVPLDYNYLDVKTVAGFLDVTPFDGVVKHGDRSKLPKGAKLNACGVRLANNKLTSLAGLDEFLERVLDDPGELRWLDVSGNKLTKVESLLLSYPKLSCVYFHGNQVRRSDEFETLGELPELRKFTAFGNPCEQSDKNYRYAVAASLPLVRSLDFTGITRKDREDIHLWDKRRGGKR